MSQIVNKFVKNTTLDLTTKVTGALPIANGGTNATSASAARSNLSAAASGANSDITSLSALSTALSVSQGGTGQTTYTDGQLLIGNTSGNTLSKATLTAGTGISVTNGNGSITIATTGTASLAWNYTSQTTAYNAAINDYVYCSGTSFAVTLPTAASQNGKGIIIQHNGTSLTQVYTINTTSGQTITGANGTITSGNYALYTTGELLYVVSDGSNWIVAGRVTNTGETDAGALSVTSSSNYVFTLAASASITIGTIYTSNGNTFYVSATTSSSTTLNCYGTGSPGASGTLTFVSGSPSGNRTFNSVSTSSPVKGSSTYEKFIWWRMGNKCNFRWDMKVGAGTAGSGDYGFFFPANLLPDTTNLETALTVLGATLTGGVVNSSIGSGWISSSINAYASAYAGNSAIMKVVLIGNGAYASGVGGNLANATSISIQGSYPVTGWQP